MTTALVIATALRAASCKTAPLYLKGHLVSLNELMDLFLFSLDRSSGPGFSWGQATQEVSC